MGLDTTHDAWHGAYSAFNRWRNTIATAAGYRLVTYRSANGIQHEVPEIGWELVTDTNTMGDWDATPADPLLVLIVHSDCDGVIHPAQAEPLAARLEELMPLLPELRDSGHIGDWREKTQRFIDGLREAAAVGEVVRFY